MPQVRPNAEEKALAVRAAVLRAGRTADQLRSVADRLLGFGAMGLGIFLAVWVALIERVIDGWTPLVLLFAASVIGIGVATLTGRCVATAYLKLRRKRLRKNLWALPEDYRGWALSSLVYDKRDDVRTIARQLINDLEHGEPAEVIPSTPPASRGDELAPAE